MCLIGSCSNNLFYIIFYYQFCLGIILLCFFPAANTTTTDACNRFVDCGTCISDGVSMQYAYTVDLCCSTCLA